MADSKKLSFSTSSKAEQIPPKFHGFVLGLVGLNDAKGIDFAQPIWPWGCPTYAPKQAKNTKNAFFACFGAYVRQPHGHIGWAKSMPFASINPNNPRTDPWNFHKKILRIDRVEKWPFFESAILNFFLQKKKKNFASSPWKLVTNYVLEWMGLNFQYYDGLQPKIRAGIINEHECTTLLMFQTVCNFDFATLFIDDKEIHSYSFMIPALIFGCKQS